MLLADRTWPDAVDLAGLGVLGALAIALPALGYALLYLDYRAYLRSLRRALVLVRGYAVAVPEWARRDTPPCFIALGLSRGCTTAEVLAAYRAQVKRLHPDAGGTRRAFARLQNHFEEAMRLASDAQPERGPASGAGTS